MRKVIVLAVITMLVLLAACGGNQMKAKPLSARTPTAAAVNEAAAPAPTPQPTPAQDSGVSAADALKELQQQMKNVTISTGPKVATTGMPPAPTGVTGKDALLARTHDYMTQSTGVTGVTDVITTFPNYHDESNLPTEYQQGGQYDN
jgi:hypothetical protein